MLVKSFDDEVFSGFTPDSRIMLTFHRPGPVEGNSRLSFFNTTMFHRLKSLRTPVSSATVSDDGQMLVTGRVVKRGDDEDEVSEIWRFNDLRFVMRLPASDEVLGFQPGGHDLIVKRGKGKKLRTLRISIPDGKITQKLGLLKPDQNARLDVRSGMQPDELVVWDLKVNQRLHLLKERGRVNSFAISPNGKWIASAGEEWYTRLWDPVTGKKAYLLVDKEAMEPEYAVDFSPDSNFLASGGKDRMLRIWKVPKN